MKTKFFFICWGMSCLFSYAQLFSNFENGLDSCWQQFPEQRWEVSTDQSLFGKYSLKHVFDNASAGSDQIACSLNGLQLAMGEVQWQFSLRHGYNPSASNYWIFFLMAEKDASSMTAGEKNNGYAVGLNYATNNDILCLYRIAEGKATEIIHSSVNWEQTVGTARPLVIRVVRSQNGVWQLMAGLHPDSLQNLGEAKDETFTCAAFMGISYRYTSTADQKLWVDNIEVNGTFVADTEAPAVVSLQVLSAHELMLVFSEPVMPPARTDFYLKENLHQPDSVSMVAPDRLWMYFASSFADTGFLHLEIANLHDMAGNVLSRQSYGFNYRRLMPYDVVVNEIMADPDPPVALPVTEYIELFNRTSSPVSLHGWQIIYGSTQRQIDSAVIESQGYLLLSTPAGCKELSTYSSCLPVFSSATSLNNEGSCIALVSREGTTVSSVCYTSLWYGDEFKSGGGWSLELIDPAGACRDEGNWRACCDPAGGTPGKKNSVFASNPDLTAPSVVQLAVLSDSVLVVIFSEKVEGNALTDVLAFTVSPGETHPVRFSFSSGKKEDTLFFTQKFLSAFEYRLHLRGDIYDCSGNRLPAEQSLVFALPEAPLAGEVVINEVLFDAHAGCPEFVELFNGSPKVVDMGSMVLTTRNPLTGEIISSARIASRGTCFFPGEYLVLTADSTALKLFYSCGRRFCQLSDMPALNDDESIVALMRADGAVLEELHYAAAMHFPLLVSTEGVSLERIYTHPLQEQNNWHSASSDAGYATPGRKNSQHRDDLPATIGNIELFPDVFTPDNDGKEDYLTIAYRFDDPGNMMAIMIFDAEGRVVKHIADNALSGTEGFFTWDGTTDAGQPVPAGMYGVYVEVVVPASRKVLKCKKTCVVFRRY